MGTAGEVISQARDRTGLHDFGSDSFVEGLSVAVESSEEEAWLDEIGVAVFRDQLVGLLSTRLAIEEWYRRHPEIDEQVITAPRFPRIASTAAGTAFLDQLAPRFKGMLPSDPVGPTECLQVLALDFRSAMLVLSSGPRYRAWLAGCDMTPAYEYHQRVLELLQWKFPPRPWRLKTPAHMHGIDGLVAVHPDARFVMTHRDIAQVMPSVVSLHDAMSEMVRNAPLPPDFPAAEAEFWEHALRKTLAFRDDGRVRFFDIRFADLQADPLHEMERLYAWTGDDLTDGVADRMRARWTSNPADEHGVHAYRPEDHGIDVDGLRRQFAFYHDRFIAPATRTRPISGG